MFGLSRLPSTLLPSPPSYRLAACPLEGVPRSRDSFSHHVGSPCLVPHGHWDLHTAWFCLLLPHCPRGSERWCPWLEETDGIYARSEMNESGCERPWGRRAATVRTRVLGGVLQPRPSPLGAFGDQSASAPRAYPPKCK